jgi:hypothetical protein
MQLGRHRSIYSVLTISPRDNKLFEARSRAVMHLNADRR